MGPVEPEPTPTVTVTETPAPGPTVTATVAPDGPTSVQLEDEQWTWLVLAGGTLVFFAAMIAGAVLRG